MARITPFRAARFDFKRAPLSRVLCPPYDVISPTQAKILRSDPVNTIHIELPQGSDKEKFKKAARCLRSWFKRGLLIQDSTSAFYLIEENFKLGGKSLRRIGLLGALGLESSSARDVTAHEQTLAKPKSERLELLKTLRLNTSPIFGLFPDSNGALRREFSRIIHQNPIARGRLQGVSYRLWRVDDPRLNDRLQGLLGKKKILLADGHHRFKVARGYYEETGDKRADSILAYFCAEENGGLAVLPTHRVVQTPGLGQAVETLCRVKKCATLAQLMRKLAAVRDLRAFGFYDKGFFLAVPRRPGGCRSGLGVEWIGRQLLAQTPPDQIRYTKDAGEAVSWARKSKGAALILKPFPASQIRKAVSKSGLLPPKSTYFYPKVPAGLVFKPL
jgi:uncharacterized protein (DUF1015 family)